jgi:signal transduction histidine kinase
MTINPQAIRAEPHVEVGQLIRNNIGVLLDRWARRAVQEQPNARRVHHQALLDHMATLLQNLAQSLIETDEEGNSVHFQTATEHGEQRWGAGWSLTEVVRDYQILRLVMLEFLDETLDRPLATREVMAVGLAIDEAITASVNSYVRSRDEQGRAQAQSLWEANRRKDEFLAMLAHELRNPLAPILNSVQVLRVQGSDDPTATQLRDIIERQAEHLARLVDDLSDLSRVSRGKIELRKERLELAGVVQLAVQASDHLIQARQHQLTVSLPEHSLWLEADRARLVQIVANLLNNAAKYTEPGGAIHLIVEHQDSEAVIRVRDTGIGIPTEMLGRVFEMFTQVDRARDHAQGGLGIGLALVRSLAEMHGGRVAVHSEGPGQGSEFVVRLPACPAMDPVQGSQPPTGDLPAATRHILIIEDNSDARKSLATLLELLGHRVEVAADGAQGVALALAARPQVALVDLGLPGMDGCEVAEKIRAALGDDHICLIALTGFGQEDDRRRTLDAGFSAHLVKPVDMEELTRLLANLPAAAP